MASLRAMLSDEQRRRADRVSYESKGLVMPLRLKLAKEFMLPPISHFPADAWDTAFEQRIQEMMAR